MFLGICKHNDGRNEISKTLKHKHEPIISKKRKYNSNIYWVNKYLDTQI